jgi:HPt (histidine-containing phosphotransfer) domain-containing protein
MFARQARSALQELASDNTDTVIASAHRLRGTAASVGASRVLAAITAYEADIGDAGKRAAVGAAVIEAENFILKLCR